ncbi:nucleoside 2-deoxyribosyltransferase [Beijerinckia indica]|uniref:Nucleoside 2-deoxyribosyltransferase n=1 Tax=Beijerinckia indica subsp. indica (strain ATCC 9039 / DSM 1715 / NCIMB 8712) TaxID=395963 RepID=B2IH38_BEII9|nr:nucleoside 2-deoxyribosyltransferase [Beijerinckia indica]ACB94452.1 nucleoside 2-deoxyribosyltransferase [Beijerinckia indica subsp. indica ATCC 9039]
MNVAQRPTLYLAGPEVFLVNAAEIGRRKQRLCLAHGFEGLFPLDNDIIGLPTGTRIDQAIYKANLAMMERADAVIVNLTPFRGPGADVGSVFELGYMAGRGKPVFGYTNVAADLAARVARFDHVTFDEQSGYLRDSTGLMVEDFGNADNLMIDACLALQNHPLVVVDAPQDQLYEDLTGFEQCLRMAAAVLQAS